jgi:poly(A) polymerase
MHSALDRIRQATRDTPFEDRLFIVGGALRDRALGRPHNQDFDLVLEEDAIALADLLYSKRLSSHAPVTYPRFGTAMLTVDGAQIELVTARAESYDPTNRKPDVRRASLIDDAYRRDFTINTLMENLHTGEMLDLTGRGLVDMEARVLRTPLEPEATFFDDPLRMLRAVRFAVQLDFAIDPGTWKAVCAGSHRLELVATKTPVVSAERIRDEWVKVFKSPNPARGIELMHESGILTRIWPEALEMVGVDQNDWHKWDVWEHTLQALRYAANWRSADDQPMPLEERLAVFLHDIGKPRTKTVDERGAHFYEHEFVGAKMAIEMLRRLKFPLDTVDTVSDLVRLHMRLGQMKPEWTDAAVRRLVRDTHEHVGSLFVISECDQSAMSETATPTDLSFVRERMDAVNAELHAAHIESALDGAEIMAELGLGPGKDVGQAKEYLLSETIEGRLAPGDKEAARAALLHWWQNKNAI